MIDRALAVGPEELGVRAVHLVVDGSLLLAGSEVTITGGDSQQHLLRVEDGDVEGGGGAVVRLCNVDILDGTPVLDVKPYVSQYDSYPGVQCGWLDRSSHTQN